MPVQHLSPLSWAVTPPSLHRWENFCLSSEQGPANSIYASVFKLQSLCFKQRPFCRGLCGSSPTGRPPSSCFWQGVMAEQSNCAQHESPSLKDVLNLLLMALFLGLLVRLCAIEEHRMWLTLFLVIYILLWMSNGCRGKILCT